MAAKARNANQEISARLYQATLTTVPSAISALLADYSFIPIEAQKEQITKFRDQAYEKYPYPCLGRWRFLDLDLSAHPLYHSDILPALTYGVGGPGQDADGGNTDWVFLDLGCCLGQDIRKLIFDGADPSRLYGADLRPDFVEIGYSLFGDRTTFPPSHFITPADVFDLSASSPLNRLDGRVGVLHVCAVFHLFDLEGQKRLAQRVLKLLDPKQQQVLVVGAQTANVSPGEYERRPGSGNSRYRHNAASWKAFWEEAISAEGWKDKVRGVAVESLLEARAFGSDQKQDEETDALEGMNESNTTQRQIGLFEEGFRWMKWSVKVDFV